MASAVTLEAGPLGMIAHPRANREMGQWLERMLAAGVEFILPEVADYEGRRNLLLEGLTNSVARLDQLKTLLTNLPLTSDVMLREGEL